MVRGTQVHGQCHHSSTRDLTNIVHYCGRWGRILVWEQDNKTKMKTANMYGVRDHTLVCATSVNFWDITCRLRYDKLGLFKDISQLNLPHGTNNYKVEKKRVCSEVSVMCVDQANPIRSSCREVNSAWRHRLFPDFHRYFWAHPSLLFVILFFHFLAFGRLRQIR